MKDNSLPLKYGSLQQRKSLDHGDMPKSRISRLWGSFHSHPDDLREVATHHSQIRKGTNKKDQRTILQQNPLRKLINDMESGRVYSRTSLKCHPSFTRKGPRGLPRLAMNLSKLALEIFPLPEMTLPAIRELSANDD